MRIHQSHMTDALTICRSLADDGLLYEDEFRKVIARCPMFAAVSENDLAQLYGFTLACMVTSGTIPWTRALEATRPRPTLDTYHVRD
jgi:hypothetical protein